MPKKPIFYDPNWGGSREQSGRDPIGKVARIKASITLDPENDTNARAIAYLNNQSFSDLINELLKIDLVKLYAIAHQRNQSLSEVINEILDSL